MSVDFREFKVVGVDLPRRMRLRSPSRHRSARRHLWRVRAMLLKRGMSEEQLDKVIVR